MDSPLPVDKTEAKGGPQCECFLIQIIQDTIRRFTEGHCAACQDAASRDEAYARQNTAGGDHPSAAQEFIDDTMRGENLSAAHEFLDRTMQNGINDHGFQQDHFGGNGCGPINDIGGFGNKGFP